jgi:hypothetical protein
VAPVGVAVSVTVPAPHRAGLLAVTDGTVLTVAVPPAAALVQPVLLRTVTL